MDRPEIRCFDPQASQGGVIASKPAQDNQYYEDDQDDTDDTDAAVTVAVTIAAEAATEAAKQEDDE
jgi:hypothetical protein